MASQEKEPENDDSFHKKWNSAEFTRSENTRDHFGGPFAAVIRVTPPHPHQRGARVGPDGDERTQIVHRRVPCDRDPLPRFSAVRCCATEKLAVALMISGADER